MSEEITAPGLETAGIEKRRVRFAALDGLSREDLPVLCQIWLDDVCAAPWGTREAMKLAAILVNYIRGGEGRDLRPSIIEARHHLTREDVKRALTLLQVFGMVEAFEIGKDEVRVALRMNPLQHLRVLEVLARIAAMSAERASAAAVAAEARWVPPPVPGAAEAASEEAAGESAAPASAAAMPQIDERALAELLHAVLVETRARAA